MTVIDLLEAQMMDPFRIGLIIALAVVTARNAAITGRILPLVTGVLFVAVIIPATMQTGMGEPLWRLAAVGVGANVIILAAVLGLRAAFRRLRR